MRRFLGVRISFWSWMIAMWGHSIRVKNLFKILRERREKRRKFWFPWDDWEIEVSDEEEAKTEANLTFPVNVYHVKNVFTVWVTRASSNSALDSLLDQLAEMVGKLTPPD